MRAVRRYSRMPPVRWARLECHRVSKMGAPKRRYCPRGHDTFVNGRREDRSCRLCKAISVKEWRLEHIVQRREQERNRHRERRKLLDALKVQPCIDCKNTYPPCVMQFDHIRPNEKFKDIAAMTTHSMDRILAEISKCEIVCANCHAIRTNARLAHAVLPKK